MEQILPKSAPRVRVFFTADLGSVGERGFSLLELLVTMSVAGILMASAVPAYNSFAQNSRQSTQISTLVEGLNYARNEAIKEDLPVSVCASTDRATCNGTNWSQGWIVRTGAGAPTPNTVLLAAPAFAGGNSASTTPNLLTVQFNANGTVAAQTRFTLCDNRGAVYARDLEINATGRVALSQVHGQMLNGTALSCP